MEQFIELLKYIARGIEYVGVLMIAGAAAVALSRLATYWKNAAVIRRDLATWILTGLEFIIAAEIISSTLVFRQEDILLLGAVVIIRILLGYTLKRELA